MTSIPVLILLLSLGSCSTGQKTHSDDGVAAARGGGDPASLVKPAPDLIEESRQSEPRTVREFFIASTQEVFVLEGCQEETDTGCQKEKKRYLANYLEVEDTKNGYLSAGGDGAQSALVMTLFKRPTGGYIVAVNQFGEGTDDYTFWEYRSGKWANISTQVVPQYSKRNIYELPRFGTTIKVFAKKIIESDDDFEISEKGEKLYDLVWKDGKFSIGNR